MPATNITLISNYAAEKNKKKKNTIPNEPDSENNVRLKEEQATKKEDSKVSVCSGEKKRRTDRTTEKGRNDRVMARPEMKEEAAT